MAMRNPECGIGNDNLFDHSACRAPHGSLALRLENVGKCYRRYARQLDRIKQWVSGRRKRWYQEHWALRNVSLTVERGQTIGVLGANGSGKSTLLQLVAGTLTPSEGTLHINGRVAALLELGSGFHPEFTGWENARLQAGILGLSLAEVEERLPKIAAFSELGEALEHPLRTYSSGMIVRLGFSVAINVDPDILLIDEALAVGDIRFQQKCMMRIKQLRDQGVTILLVTHDLSAIKRLCDQAHVLQDGRLVRSGPSDLICNWYFGQMTDNAPPSPPGEEGRGEGGRGYFRHGDGRARIESWTFLNEEEKPTDRMWLGDTCKLRVKLRFLEPVDSPVLGFYLRDRFGTEVLGTNTQAEQTPLLTCQSGDRIEVTFRFALRVRPGVYTLCVALADNSHQTSVSYLDWIDNAQLLEVLDPHPDRVIHGLVAEEYEVVVTERGASGPCE